MEHELANRLERYRTTYAKPVRDLAETFCSATTRLGAEGAPTATVADALPMATSHGVDVHALVAAIAEYALIEMAMEAEALKAFRRGPLTDA